MCDGLLFLGKQRCDSMVQLFEFSCSYSPPFHFFATRSRNVVTAAMASMTSCLGMFGALGWEYRVITTFFSNSRRRLAASQSAYVTAFAFDRIRACHSPSAE